TRDGNPFTEIRVDTTGLNDAKAVFGFDNRDPDGGLLEAATTGPITPAGGLVLRGNTVRTLNALRDPVQPFLANATLIATGNIRTGDHFTNTGTDALWMPYADAMEGTTDQHRVVTMRDPLTGKTRLIFGDDQGVFTALDQGNGQLLASLGSVE